MAISNAISAAARRSRRGVLGFGIAAQACSVVRLAGEFGTRERVRAIRSRRKGAVHGFAVAKLRSPWQRGGAPIKGVRPMSPVSKRVWGGLWGLAALLSVGVAI